LQGKIVSFARGIAAKQRFVVLVGQVPLQLVVVVVDVLV
jgi:hypothetical protein